MNEKLLDTAVRLCSNAKAQGRDTLLEPELYSLLRAGGVDTPDFFTVPVTGHEIVLPDQHLPSERVVLKVVSDRIVHKTELGGVLVVDNNPDAIRAGIRGILASVKHKGGDELFLSVKEVLVAQFIRSGRELGSQLFVGLRWTHDMGHVVAMGFGGLDTEELAQRFESGEATVLASPHLLTPQGMLDKFARSFAYRKMTGRTRAARKHMGDAALLHILTFFHTLAVEFSNQPELGYLLWEFEVNPFFAVQGKIVAVDAYLRFSTELETMRTSHPKQIGRLLEPKTAAIIGASRKLVNVGRIILRNFLRDKFPVENLRVVREDLDDLDGVQCVASVDDLPWQADMLVVAVAATRVPEIVRQVVAGKRANALVLIPGGMGETEEGRLVEQKMRLEMEQRRDEGGWTPVFVGPNCLGIRSRPGKYDSMFIPETRLPLPEGDVTGAALVCQSGAFMITRMNDLPYLDPDYAITTGNQMDLTVTDFAEALLHDEKIEVITLYIEGFKNLDGLRLARLVQKGRKMGKDFVVYRAGRTSEGKTATSSHTASISGDWDSCVEVLKDAGALLAFSFRQFKAFLELAALLRAKKFAGLRMGAMSNAGYETVGMADNVPPGQGLELSPLSGATQRKIDAVLQKAGIASLVNVRNPLDLTPMAPDVVHERCLEAILSQESVDAVIMGFVPLTPALKALPLGEGSIDEPGSLATILPELLINSDKPVVTVVDAGHLYDPLAEALRQAGIPCFRSSDFAMKMFIRFLQYKVGA